MFDHRSKSKLRQKSACKRRCDNLIYWDLYPKADCLMIVLLVNVYELYIDKSYLKISSQSVHLLLELPCCDVVLKTTF